jgi:hypothetical protein
MQYTWEVTGLKTTADGGVVQTYWKKIGTDENGRVGTFSGATPFEVDPTDPNYIPFDNLTELDVLGWIRDVVIDGYERHVNEQIQKQIDLQTIVNAPLPWVSSEDIPSEP